MAIGLIKFRSGKKGKGVPHYNYAMHEKNYLSKDTDQDKAVFKKSGNMPNWAKDDPRLFWQAGDKYERDNGTSYREHILPLARELTLEQQIKKVDDWIDKKIGDKHPYSYAIHYKLGKDGQLQPHAHLFWSERILDGIERTPEQFFRRYNKKNPSKGGCQKASLGMNKYQLKKFGQTLSKEWRQHVNKHLEINGIDTRIDELSNREKGLAPKQAISYIDMQNPVIEQAYVEMLQARAELEQSEHELSLIDWDSELSKLEQQTQPVINAPVIDEPVIEQLEQSPPVATVEPVAPVVLERSDKASEQAPPPVAEPVAKPRTAQAYLDQLKARLGESVTQAPTTVEQLEQSPPPVVRDVIAEYTAKRDTIARKIFDNSVNALTERYNKLSQKLNELVKAKPNLIKSLFETKDHKTWANKYDKAVTARDRALQNLDDYKQQGVGSGHYLKADEHIKQHDRPFYDEYIQAYTEQLRKDGYFDSKPSPVTKAPSPVAIERETMLGKAKISLQTIKNVIDTMPDGEKKTKAIDSYNEKLQSFEKMSDDELRQVTASMPDTVANKTPEAVIKAPTEQDTDKGR